MNNLPFLPAIVGLAAVLACSVDKSGDDDTGATTGATTSATTGATADPSGSDTGPGSSGDAPTTAEPTGTTGVDSSTGGDTEAGESNPPCIDTPTVLGLDEVSMGGFSGAEVLDQKLFPHTSTLTFESEPTTLGDAWKGKTMPLKITLSHDGGEVRWIDSEINPDWDDSGNESGFGADCADRLEIDVKLDFVTEGKEFDEHRDAVLTATQAARAEVQAKLLPPGLMGSLDLTTIYTPAEPATTITGVWIFATWDVDKSFGSVMHEINVGGEDGFAGFGPLATWGDEFGG